MSGRIREYTRATCPICGHRGWCGRRDDGLVLCRRPPTPVDVPGFTYRGLASDGATAMYVEAGCEHAPRDVGHASAALKPPTAPPLAVAATPPAGTPSDRTIDPTWLTDNYPKLTAALTDERRGALATALGLPDEAMVALAIGWWAERRWWNPGTEQLEGEPGCWTFPEHDANGRIVGLGLRWPTGRKGQMAGGKRGLTLPHDWRSRNDPILIVEGPSDVLAGRCIGLSVVGRPSNVGGATLLAAACRHRRVIVLGEHDRKPDGRWPGREGAETVAAALAAAWNRPVPTAYPPDDIKDLREWVAALMADGDDDSPADIIMQHIAPPPVLLHIGRGGFRRVRTAVSCFRWTDPVDAPSFFMDRIDLDAAKARARFIEAVVDVEPLAVHANLEAQLLRLARSPAPEPKKAVGRSSSMPPPTVLAGAASPLPQIQGNERQLRDVRAEALAALLVANDPPRLFDRAGGVARVCVDQDEQGQAIPQIHQLDATAVRGELTNAADWFTVRHTRDGDVTAADHPPLAVARDILALPSIDLPPLIGVITCPTFAPNGKLIVADGYDTGSRLWHHPTVSELPPIPEQPSVAEITAARDTLCDVIADFPFVDDASRANAIALMLLPFVRPLITGPTPLHAIDAPTPGTGKGLLAQVCLWPSLGYSLDMRTGAKDGDEWRKRITSELVAGKSVIGFDNATARLDSEHLAGVLTTTLWTDRILGQTQVVTAVNRATWVCTGNNLSFSKELARRVVWIRLDAKVETPESRTGFRHPHLLTHVRAQRSRLVAAALTLCRAWLAADRPAGGQVMGSFESYAATIGGILKVADLAGFLGNAGELRRQMDGETTEWRAFVHAWWERWGQSWVGSSDLAQLLWMEDGKRSELLAGVVTSERERGVVTQLGMRLSSKRDCVIGGYRVDVNSRSDRAGRLKYRLMPIEPEGGVAPQSSETAESTDLLQTSRAGAQTFADLQTLKSKVCAQVCADKPPSEQNLDAARRPCIPFSHTFYSRIGAIESEHAHTRVRGGNSSTAKRYARSARGSQAVDSEGVTAADLGADLAQTLADARKGLQNPAPAAVPADPPRPPPAYAWLTTDQRDIPTHIQAMAAPHDGWSPEGWHARLLQMADRCADAHPARAEQLRQAARLMERRNHETDTESNRYLGK